MIRLSRMADYAVALMGCLARQPESRFSAHELAEKSAIPLPTVSKILKSLLRAELLTSVRGMHGGYALVREASTVTVADVIEAVDGPIALTDCLSGQKHECGIESLCPTRPGWHKLNIAVRAALESVTLEDITGGSPAPARKRDITGERVSDYAG